MKKNTCLIIDDEAHSRETTKMMLHQLYPEIEILGMAKNALEGSEMVRRLAPEFIILDIQMPGKSGIEMIDMIPHYRGEIVFVTAFNDYAIEAFKKGALHYILKPIDPEELAEAIQRVRRSMSRNQPQGKYLSLSTGEGWVVVRIDDILRCESFKNYTTIYLPDGQHTISKTLKEVEDRLSGDQFYRIHNSHLIHIAFIEKILKTDGGNVLLTNGDLVPISKGKKKEFFEWFKRHVEGI